LTYKGKKMVEVTMGFHQKDLEALVSTSVQATGVQFHLTL
jgi:hypothetical protein